MFPHGGLPDWELSLVSCWGAVPAAALARVARALHLGVGPPVCPGRGGLWGGAPCGSGPWPLSAWLAPKGAFLLSSGPGARPCLLVTACLGVGVCGRVGVCVPLCVRVCTCVCMYLYVRCACTGGRVGWVFLFPDFLDCPFLFPPFLFCFFLLLFLLYFVFLLCKALCDAECMKSAI